MVFSSNGCFVFCCIVLSFVWHYVGIFVVFFFFFYCRVTPVIRLIFCQKVGAVWYCAVFCDIIWYWILYRVVLYGFVLCRMVLHHVALYHMVVYGMASCCTVLYWCYKALYWGALVFVAGVCCAAVCLVADGRRCVMMLTLLPTPHWPCPQTQLTWPLPASWGMSGCCTEVRKVN